MTEYKTPFTKSYVLKETTRHMRRSIDISIRKTFERMEDFTNDGEKKKEVYETLDVLHKMRGIIDDFQQNNQHLFVDDHEESKEDEQEETQE